MITFQNARLLQLENTVEALKELADATHAALTAADQALRTATATGSPFIKALQARDAAQVAYDGAYRLWSEAQDALDAESDVQARMASVVDEIEEDLVAAAVAETWKAGERTQARLIQLVDLAGADISLVHHHL